MYKYKGTRYGAKMLCAYDYVRELPLTRTEIRREDCLNAISEMFKIDEEPGRSLNNQIGRDHIGIGKLDVTEDRFDKEYALYEYNKLKREILASTALKEEFETEGIGLFELADAFSLNPWTIMAWMTLRKRMPWFLVTTIESAQQNGNWTVKGVVQTWLNFNAKVIESDRRKKNGLH